MTPGMHHRQVALSNSFYQPARPAILPSSQTMMISNNANGNRIKRDTLSCDDIVDHCNNNSDQSNDNNSLRRACNNPYAKVSLEKLGFVTHATPPPHMTQSYHPHSIFYGQQYHRIQPFSSVMTTSTPPAAANMMPICLTDSFEHLSVIHPRHSGSSFRSSNTQSPPSSVLMEDNCKENPYECIPAHFKQEAVTRFDINIDG